MVKAHETRQSISIKQRQRILERDSYRCIKCGRRRLSTLVLHHILPVVFGGADQDFNLITLCETCHEDVPDDLVDFVKFASTHLPPDFHRSKDITKLLCIILLRDFGAISQDDNGQTFNHINHRIDELYEQLWQVFRDDSLDALNDLMSQATGTVNHHDTP